MPGPIPDAARSKACVCGRSFAGTAGSNPAGDTDVCLLTVVRCQKEVSTSGWSLIQMNPTMYVCHGMEIRCNNNPLHLHWGCRRFESKNDRQARMTPQSKQDCFLPHPFHLMIRQSSYHCTSHMSDPDNVFNKLYINTRNTQYIHYIHPLGSVHVMWTLRSSILYPIQCLWDAHVIIIFFFFFKNVVCLVDSLAS